LSAFEYGGFIREWQEDALILEVKNRLLPGDVLEFLPPGEIDVVRLRLYEFESAETGKVTEKVTAGEQRAIRIPLAQFHDEAPHTLPARLPVLSVARKARPLNAEQESQLIQNQKSHKVEQGLLPAETLMRSSDDRAISLSSLKGARPPKLGAEGCCGLGCNGCLPFWNDDSYAKARDLLSKKRGLQKLNRGDAAHSSAHVINMDL
jgi:putative protease